MQAFSRECVLDGGENMKLKGAGIVVSCLLEQGVDTVFGYPGVSILEVYDELYKNRSRIRHILSAHEQGAAHAADGYARSSGKVGVCLATSGPGATNLITGIAAAFMDSSPVVFITCNVDENLLGRDAFQEVDIVGISMPITKCSYLVDDARNIAGVMREAFALAAGGRPGPVLIDITHNATVQKAEYEYLPKELHGERGMLGRAYRRSLPVLRRPEFQSGDISRMAELVSQARKPLLLAGGGVIRSGASGALREYAERTGIPVVSTLMGLGAMEWSSGLYFGMAGSFGCPAANYAVQSCDTLIALGVRFSDRLTGRVDAFAPNARIIHVDIDRAEIDKNVRSFHHVVGDAGEILAGLMEYALPAADGEWLGELRARREAQAAVGGFPETIIHTIQKKCPNALIATDVGQHQLWTCRCFGFSNPGQLITSGGYGAMGFGLGAALGAKAGNPDKTVIHITGDGSFGMNMTELMTEMREKLPVITVIFDNTALGLVRQNQTLNYSKRYSQTSLTALPDYSLLAGAFGLEAVRAENAAELEAALDRFLAGGRGGIIDCVVDRDELICPMLDKGRLIY